MSAAGAGAGPTGAESRWWGWGGDRGRPHLPAGAERLLRERLGADPGRRRPPVALEQVRLPAPRIGDALLRALRGAVGEECVRTDREARVRHSAGRSYPDLVRLRAGEPAHLPDAVVNPGSAAEVAAVLGACAEAGCAVVPFGGGTSVVGGVDPDPGPLGAAIALDLRRLDGVGPVDRTSLTATLGGGLRLPRAEAVLHGHGLTLGHFPQSYEAATVGGGVATRSAGQASTGFGRLDRLVLGLRLAAPAGELVVPPLPATAAGPSLLGLVTGSEGVLGVITEATLAVRPLPAARRYEGWMLPSFAAGAEALRALAQSGAAPDVARLSDEAETGVAMLGAAGGALAGRALSLYLRRRGVAGGALAIAGFEGSEREVRRRRARAARVLRAAGAAPLGRRAGEAWLRGRYAGPYLRDDLLDRGVMVETLETATSWSRLPDLHAGVGRALREALEARGTPAEVSCHISHLYRSGASLYFTFMARQEPGAELDQWRAAKLAASEAIVAAGATITHHHAIGTDHRRWMPAEVGELGLEALRAVKSRLDPAGIMNPGKLLP